MARPVRRFRLSQVPAGEPRPEPEAHGPRLRRHLLLAPARSRDADGGDARRPRHGRAAGQGAVRGHLVVLGGAHRRGGRDPARSGHAAPDPPALVLHAQPLDRARPARRPRRRGRRLHRLLAARPGHAHRPLSRRHSGRFAGQPQRLAVARHAHRPGAREDPSARRARQGAAVRRWRRWHWPGRCAIRA